MYDGLFCAFDQVRHGRRHREVRGVGRPRPRRRRTSSPPQSHERAAARQQGRPVRQRDRPGRGARSARATRSWSTTDEGVRGDTTAESLGGLRPAFDKAGNITAGNASPDLRRRRRGHRRRRRPRPSELGVDAARRDRRLRPGRRPRPVAAHPAVARHQGRARARPASRSATSTCSSSTRRSPPSALASMADLGITDDIVNVNGGAIALGHPIGMSGTRVALTLAPRARAPRRRPRCRRAVRRRRPGRRHPGPLAVAPDLRAQRADQAATGARAHRSQRCPPARWHLVRVPGPQSAARRAAIAWSSAEARPMSTGCGHDAGRRASVDDLVAESGAQPV